MSEKNNSNEKKYTPINKHKRKGKIFSSPHIFLENVKPIAWDRDMLPTRAIPIRCHGNNL